MLRSMVKIMAEALLLAEAGDQSRETEGCVMSGGALAATAGPPGGEGTSGWGA